MSSIGDKLHSAFSRMARESAKSSSDQGRGATKSDIANALGKAGDAYQLNQETEIASGFDKLYGNKPSSGFGDSLFDKLDLQGLADKVDVEGIVDNIDLDNLNNDREPVEHNDPEENNDQVVDDEAANANPIQNNPQACQLIASHQTAFDELTQSIANDFQTAVTALDNATNRTGRRNATDDLWTWTRSHFPNMELMQGIAQSQTLTETQKSMN